MLRVYGLRIVYTYMHTELLTGFYSSLDSRMWPFVAIVVYTLCIYVDYDVRASERHVLANDHITYIHGAVKPELKPVLGDGGSIVLIVVVVVVGGGGGGGGRCSRSRRSRDVSRGPA